MPTVQDVIKDTDFISLPEVEQRKVLRSIDPDFNALSDVEQDRAFKMLTQGYSLPEKENIATSTFLNPPEGETKLSQERPIRKAISNIYTPLLEGAGMLAGAIVGAPGGVLTEGAAVAGGFAGGKSSARGLDVLTGLEKPPEIMQEAGHIAKDLGEGAVYGAVGRVINKYIVDPIITPIAQKLSSAIRGGIEKGVRPTVAGKRTAAQGEAYLNNAESAVKSIIVNKDHLSLTNKNGEVVTGKLPSTLKEFSQAIEQTRKNIFDQYDSMQLAAGGKNAVIDLKPIVKELLEISENSVIKSEAPAVAQYAKKKANAYINQGGYTPSEAQGAIATINEELQSFYKNPKYSFSGRKSVDDMVVTNLRKSLDDVIEKTTGEGGYQELKNAYGALKSIEKDVNHRAVVDARKNKIGFFGYADIWTAAEVVSAITDPSKLPRAMAIQGAKRYINWINNPNRIIKGMFLDAEKLMSKLPTSQKEKVIEAIKQEPGVYRYNPEFKGIKSQKPTKLETEIQPGEPPLEIPKTERLFPDQLSTVREGKMALSNAKSAEERIGMPLIQPGPSYSKSSAIRPLEPNISPLEVERAKKLMEIAKNSKDPKEAIKARNDLAKMKINAFRLSKGLKTF